MVSTRSRMNSKTMPVVDLPQKRTAESEATERPTKKPLTPKAVTSDIAVGKPVTANVTLLNQEGNEVVIADTFREQGVVFFMYPRANTPGCTKQACGFRDNIQTIKDSGFTVYGLSGDSPKSLSKWKTKENLPFDLLSDPEHKLISHFGSSLPGKKVQRSHVVILKGGVVGDIAAKVTPANSVSRAVEYVKSKSGAEFKEETSKEEEPAKEEEPLDVSGEMLTEGSIVTFAAELLTEASVSVKVQDLFQTRGAIFFMYPKADTPGCTTQACGFNDNLEAISAAGFDVYGLGADTPSELLAWKEAQNYKYTFLSDPKHQLIGYFGSSLSDGTRVERSHVIVLPGGKVGQIKHTISPEDSVSTGLAFVKSYALDNTSRL
ncbi:putative alkyl hydroperoxide reductase subunit C/ Thiol specific antioxidant, Thioredoxin [Plasmopara halstedii]